MFPSERRLAAQAAAHTSWAKAANRTARTGPGRAALDKKFLDAADGDPVRAASFKKAYFARLALKSAQSRRKARELTELAKVAEAELPAVADQGFPLETATAGPVAELIEAGERRAG
jgi:hypothetical protein